MAITFIDNQPIRFNSAKFDDQACINKDLSGYAVLMQPEDPLNFQAKQYCCGDNLACDADELGAELVTAGDFSTLCGVDWTCDAGWVIAGGEATLTPPGGGAAPSISQSGLAITTGKSYRITITIVSNSTNYGVDVYLGGRRAGTIDANATGEQIIYGVAGTTGIVAFGSNNDYSVPDTGELVITNASVKEIASCYTFDTSTTEYIANGAFTGGATGWTFDSSWTYAANAVTHTTPAGTSSVTQLLNIERQRADILWAVTISARTAGTLTMVFGLVTLTSSSANGVLTINSPNQNLADDLFRLSPTGGFDGTVDDASATQTASGWSYNPTDGFCHEVTWVNAFYAGNTLTIGNYYKMTIQVSMTEGELVVEAGGVELGTITQSGIYNFYFTALTTAGEMFTPSSDFDGCILPAIELCQLRRDYEMRLVYEDGSGATDWHDENSSSNPINYDEDWVTWRVTSLDAILSGGIPVELPYSCYRVEFRDYCDAPGSPPIPFLYTSDTIINYTSQHPCTKRIRAWADGVALGFNFGNNGNIFMLIQRFRTLYMTPTYPISGEDYTYSTGTKKRIYASVEKHYEMLFDYMDEYGHDTMGNGMIPCDIFEIDGVEYLVIFKDYEPNWAERGKRNLAQSTIEVQKRIEKVLFNRNCST